MEVVSEDSAELRDSSVKTPHVGKQDSEHQDTGHTTTTSTAASAPTDKKNNKNPSAASYNFDGIDPPLSLRERANAWILRKLDSRFFQIMGIVVLVLIVADGALFFFMLMGWQTLCTPRTDCEPRNWIYNFSVQFLTACFTYMVTVAWPWRQAQLVHVFGIGCPYRNNDIGYDMYGQERENDIWYHFPLKHRRGIIILLHLNVYTQYANQVMRWIFNTYEKQDTMPGVLAVNIFFGLSFLFAGIAGIWQLIVEQNIRKNYPGKFDPGLVQVIGYYAGPYLGWLCPCCKCCRRRQEPDMVEQQPQGDEEEAHDKQEEEQVPDEEKGLYSLPVPVTSALQRLDPRSLLQKHSIKTDPSRNKARESVIPTPRPELRLWGL